MYLLVSGKIKYTLLEFYFILVYFMFISLVTVIGIILKMFAADKQNTLL